MSAPNRPSTDSLDVGRVDDEKHRAEADHTEGQLGGITQEDVDFVNNFPEDRKKRVLSKIDWRLMPMLVFLYLLAYLDKTNIGNAKIEGLTDDLHMHGIDYNVAVAVFLSHIFFAVPSNMILHKFRRPSFYMGGIIIVFGTIMTLNGIVKNFGGLIAVRLFLGVFEAGFLPGAILIISNWYLPNEVQTRIALLYTSAATGGAFSGLLAFAIAKMDGVGGLGGWRWIFILEGIVTVLVGVACFFFLIDTPALSTRWLDADEIRYLELRQIVRRTSNPREFRDNSKHFDRRLFKQIVSDFKIYLLTFINWSNTAPNYALKFTMPTILKTMGYSSATSQLMTIPPYMCGAISSLVIALFADKYRWRFPFIVGPQSCLIVAFSILFAKAGDIDNNVGVMYFAVCLACSGMYPILPGSNAWLVSNTPDPAKKSINIALLLAIGNIGGLIGSYIYLEREKPLYPTGYGTSLGFAFAGIVAASLMETFLSIGNKRRAQLSEAEIRAKYTSEELDQMGEKSPLFKYSL